MEDFIIKEDKKAFSCFSSLRWGLKPKKFDNKVAFPQFIARINNILSNPSVIAALSTLLHDAIVDKILWHEKAGQCEIYLGRIFYEGIEKSKTLKFITVYKYPRISTRIIVNGAMNVINNRRPGLDETQPEQIREMGIIPDKHLFGMMTNFGLLKVEISEESSLEIADTGIPSKEPICRDYFWPLISQEELSSLIKVVLEN